MSKSDLLALFRLTGHVLLLAAVLLRLVFFCSAGLRSKYKEYRFFDIPLAIGVAMLLTSHFVLSLFYVPSRSMLPTLQVGDGIAVNRLGYRWRAPKVGDIVVFDLPPNRPGGGQTLVKRMAADEGDIIRIERGLLYRNDQLDATVSVSTEAAIKEHKIAPGCIFVLGDNRTMSMDSRAYGDVKKDWLYGPVVYRYWPPSRIGGVK
ncbi:MAG: signal peptidase I [Candidatus Eremiobacteraeota bacterium]|nr:signal peptidase I [Candidatus Eremiobacteraeota bacterium]